MWSEVVQQVHCLWGLLGGIGQCQQSPVFFSGPLGISYKVISGWLLLVLDLEVPRRGSDVNQVWLLLVSGLGPLSERYGACWSQMLLVWEILGKSKAWARPLVWKSHWKPLGEHASGWVGVSGSLQGRGNSVSQVHGVSDMLSALCLCVGRAWKRNNSLCWHICLAEICSIPQLSPWYQIIQFLPVCPWCLLSCYLSARAQSKWV